LAVVAILAAVLSTAGYYGASPGAPNKFLNPGNLVDNLAEPMSYYAIMAVGMTCVVVTGGIDLSVGAVMAMSALGAAWELPRLYRPDAPGWQVIPVALAITMGIGLICGLINGLLVVGMEMHPFIVTLGTLSIYRGIDIYLPPQATLPLSNLVIPASFGDHFIKWRMAVGSVTPTPLIVTLVVVLIGWFFLSKTIAGRETYAVGGNEEAARFSGLRTGVVKLRVYVISGMLAGVAGMVTLGYYQSVSSVTADGYELMVVAAAVVGGASLMGGRGSAVGALLGALIIALIEDGITLFADSKTEKIIVGVLIIVAVAIDGWTQKLRVRRTAAEKTI
jgi:ribose/xylose/arabinose/galactoside ABC-type transport system permease subunit